MKAEELMIGDWVRNDLDEIQQVQEIRSDSENSVMLAYGDFYGFDEIEPIPLTPGILEKNGFRKDDETDQWYFKSEDRLDLGLLAVGIDDGCGVGLCVMRNGAITYYCKYVHELQHYLLLIGGAEEIIL